MREQKRQNRPILQQYIRHKLTIIADFVCLSNNNLDLNSHVLVYGIQV